MATSTRNMEAKNHAFASAGIPAQVSCLPNILRPVADLRLRERFLFLGFLSKPEVFGGVGFSITVICVLS